MPSETSTRTLPAPGRMKVGRWAAVDSQKMIFDLIKYELPEFRPASPGDCDRAQMRLWRAEAE